MEILKRLSAPRSFQAGAVAADRGPLKWGAPRGTRPAYYVVLRGGRAMGKTTKRTSPEKKVKAGTPYRYSVRGYDKHKKAGAPAKSVRVKAPKTTTTLPTTTPVPPI